MDGGTITNLVHPRAAAAAVADESSAETQALRLPMGMRRVG